MNKVSMIAFKYMAINTHCDLDITMTQLFLDIFQVGILLD